MNLSKTIEIELTHRGSPIQIGGSAVAGDSGSRSLIFRLLENGKPWTVPDGVRAALAFHTPQKYSGEYDQMPDGTDAFYIEGNLVTVRLVDQIMAAPGLVTLLLTLRDESLRQLSAFPMVMEVFKGIEDTEHLSKQYYQVRDLRELNAVLDRLFALLETIDTEAVHHDATEARTAAEEAKEAARSVNADEIARLIERKGDDLYVEGGKLYLTSNGSIVGEGVRLEVSGGGDIVGGMAFDSGYVDGDNYLHLTQGGQDIDGFTPFQIPGGGVASNMWLRTSIANTVFSILDTDDMCEIPFEWNSTADGVATGSGTMEWSVDDRRVASGSINQGADVFDVLPYLTSGAEHHVVLKITNAYGTFRRLEFYITVASFGLSWNLGEAGIYADASVQVRLTPTGSGEKSLYVAVDGAVVSEGTVTTTGRTVTVTIGQQSHGAHTITAWLEIERDGGTVRTEPLRHTGVWLASGVNTPVVGVLTPEIGVAQYGTAAVRYIAVDPAGEAATVVLMDGETVVNTLHNVGRSIQTWSYKAVATGQRELTIKCGSASARVVVNVTDLGFTVNPVTEGLLLDLDPAGHSNAEQNRASFGYTDDQGANHPLTFSEGFDWENGGFRTDENGVTAFVIKRGDRVTLDRGLFDTDCRTSGKNIKLIWRADNVRDYDAQLMTCKSGSVGLVVNAQNATVSSQLETMTVPYYEGSRIEMDVCINAEGEDSLAWIDLKAVQSCPPIRYGATDSWAQANPVPLVIGSDDADIWLYRLKLYGSSLNRYEILDNHIADCGDPAEMAERHRRNDIYNTDGSISLTKVAKANPHMRTIHIRADRMTTGTDDDVTCDVEIVYETGGQAHRLTASGVTMSAQGTSSLEYILAALNLDLDFSTATSWVNGLGQSITSYAMTEESVPVSYFNLKANVASSESANNVCLADEYNTWNPYICDPKKTDMRVRDTVEGHPCAVFFTSTADTAIEVGARTVQPGETILYFVGDMNNSKKNFAVFGQDNAKYPKQCCVEVMNNTELQSRFKEEVRDDETWKDGNFEFRFPKNPNSDMKHAFMDMQRWVVSTDRSAATNEALPGPFTYAGKTYYGDSAEYRAAKFKAEFANYFVPEAMDFHYLFTDCHLMIDNRAKNLFFCYEYVAELNDYRWSVRCDYDNDTGLGNDNSGGLTFTYGLEDTDRVGDSWVFNAHDSVLWCNVRDLRAEELRLMHTQLAGKGVWNADRLAKKWNDYQGAVCESLRAEDMHNKYFLPWLLKDGAAYAKKCCGTKEYQREQFLRYQQPYKASQYIDVSNRADAISMRATIEDAEAGNVTLTGYSDMYFVVMYGNGGTVKVRAKRGEATLIECPTDSLGDTETYIFSASNLSAISSLAQLKPKFVLATTAARLQELIVGSDAVGYQNLNLNQIGVGNNRMLRVLNVQGCPKLETAMDLSALESLERFLANGSGITGVTFARGCPLMEARLPAVASLVALELRELETFVMDSSKLTLIRVEGCPGIDTLSICRNALTLERGRITDVDWADGSPDTLLRLAALSGYDAQGRPVDKFVLTGRAYVNAATQLEADTIRAAFPDLELTVGSIVPGFVVEFINHNGDLLDSQTVRQGGYAVDPAQSGRIATPAKAADVEYTYRYVGWDKALGPVMGNLTIIAQFAASVRYYTVTHWADGTQSGVLQRESVIAHGSCPYEGSDPMGTGIFVGWDAEAVDVVSDMDIHPVFVTPELPGSVASGYDYLWSNDPSKRSGYTTAQFLGILKENRERDYFAIGDRIHFAVKSEAFADLEFVLELRSFKHFESAQREGFAGPYFGMVGVMNATQQMNGTATNAGGWPAMSLRPFLNETVFPALPKVVRMMIEQIRVRSSAGNTSAAIVEAEDWLTLESVAELGHYAEAVPYCDEIAQGADEVTFSCYTNGSSRNKKHYNGTGTEPAYYWTRSPYASNTSGIYNIINSNGNASTGNPPSRDGISFGFCLKTGEEVGA